LGNGDALGDPPVVLVLVVVLILEFLRSGGVENVTRWWGFCPEGDYQSMLTTVRIINSVAVVPLEDEDDDEYENEAPLALTHHPSRRTVLE
jgi:hypothetical protein